ncbi:type II secretion system protein, partial [bacterium]|nr:type II secretion system protein [bacterium]
ETLIVMGIIGVVAALTIPNVNKNTGRAESVAKLKKIHAELNEAHSRATAVYGPFETWFVNDSCSDNTNCFNTRARYFNRITEFMKLQKNCGCKSGEDELCGVTAVNNGCMSGSNKLLYGDPYSMSIYSQTYPRAIVASGWSFAIVDLIKNRTYSPPYYGYTFNKSIGTIMVDIDGPKKGKNTVGIDLFEFVITSDGIYPYGGGTYWDDAGIKDCARLGYKCTEWVIRNGNMDYLDAYHTNDSNKGKCKSNGKQLSTTVSSCK